MYTEFTNADLLIFRVDAVSIQLNAIKNSGYSTIL